jgi:hypothetical protein
MKRRRHTPEQIIGKLREADRLLAEGHQVPERCTSSSAGSAATTRAGATGVPMPSSAAKAGA